MPLQPLGSGLYNVLVHIQAIARISLYLI